MTVFADEAYAAVEPVAQADEANGFVLRALVRAIGSMYGQVEEAVRAREGHDAWTQPFDVDRTPDFLLPFVGQAVGVLVTAGLTPEEQRQQIKEEGGWKRQLTTSLIAAVQRTLTLTKRVRLIERVEGKPWHIQIATQTAETPSVATTELFGRAAKSGGLIATFIQTSLPVIDEGTITIEEAPGVIESATIEDIT